MGSLLRHHPGGVSVRSERPGITGPWGRRRRGTCSPARLRERSWGDAGVYTDWRKWPLGAVSGHLCTLLRRGGRASGRWGRRSVHRLAKMGSRRRSGAFVYTVASRGSRERSWGARECTQIGENGLSAPFWGICVHCCVAGVARAVVGGAGVYTDRRKWALGAVLGHLCTLLRCGDRASGRGGRRSVHRLAKMASRRSSGAFVYTVATRGSRERTVGTRECTQIGENGLSEPFRGICVHCCDARLRRVARAAPSRGRRLHRGVNPHKP